MAPFDAGLAKIVLDALCEAPEGQVAPELRQKCIDFREEKHSLPEVYDFIVKIGEEPLTNISKFIRVLCDFKAHYERPT